MDGTDIVQVLQRN